MTAYILIDDHPEDGTSIIEVFIHRSTAIKRLREYESKPHLQYISQYFKIQHIKVSMK